MLLIAGSLAACATEENGGVLGQGAEPPTLSDFCAAVERAPKDDTSLALTQAAAADVEENAPPEIRADVTTLREAVDKMSAVAELEAFGDQGGPVRAAWRRYHEYIEEACPLY